MKSPFLGVLGPGAPKWFRHKSLLIVLAAPSFQLARRVCGFALQGARVFALRHRALQSRIQKPSFHLGTTRFFARRFSSFRGFRAPGGVPWPPGRCVSANIPILVQIGPFLGVLGPGAPKWFRRKSLLIALVAPSFISLGVGTTRFFAGCPPPPGFFFMCWWFFEPP